MIAVWVESRPWPGHKRKRRYVLRWQVPELDATGKPIRELEVTVRGGLDGRKVTSIQQGELKPEETEQGWRVKLPLEVTDCVMVREGE